MGYVLYSQSSDSESRYYCLPGKSKTKSETIRLSAHPPDLVLTQEPLNIVISCAQHAGNFIHVKPLDFKGLNESIKIADSQIRRRIALNARWMSRSKPLVG